MRYDVTVMPPLLLGEEYVKTMGHYHAPVDGAGSYPEVFEVLEGEAQFLIQRQQGEEIVDVSLLTAREGDKALISSDCGHVLINASSRQLVTGNLISNSCVQSYNQYLQRRGAAFYVLAGRRPVRNPRYSVPEIHVSKVKTPSLLSNRNLVEAFQENTDRFTFLNKPSKCSQLSETA